MRRYVRGLGWLLACSACAGTSAATADAQTSAVTAEVVAKPGSGDINTESPATARMDLRWWCVVDAAGCAGSAGSGRICDGQGAGTGAAQQELSRT